MKIACIGDNCIDSYDETGKYYPGGNAVNVAVYLRRMGVESSETMKTVSDCAVCSWKRVWTSPACGSSTARLP